MKGDVFLVYPPSPVMNREDRCQQPTDSLIVIPPLPPTDLLYSGSITKSVGMKPVVKDYSLNSETIDDFKCDLKEIRPKYLVANVASTTLNSDLEVFKAAKEVLPDIICIAKGAHFNIFDVKTMEDNPSLDIVIRNEAEFTFKEILENKPYEDILGITYRSGSVIIKNPKRPFIENLDEIPYPSRDLIDNSVYKRPDTGEVQAVIKVSRGCPYHCFFCLATPVSGAKVRKRSPENIVGEIKECYEKYNIKNFIFWSDLFNSDNKWVSKLCEKIIELGFDITFSTNTRADSAEINTVKLMKKAGCSLVSIGIESGSELLLSKMGKKITKEQIKNTVQMFKKEGIKVYGYYVLGLPWESYDTYRETMKFAKSLNTEFVSFYTATALVGTKFYDYVKENNLGGLNFDMPYYYPSVDTHYLSKNQVFKLHKKALREYYLRPKYILMMLFKIKSPKEFFNYFNAALRVFFRR